MSYFSHCSLEIAVLYSTIHVSQMMWSPGIQCQLCSMMFTDQSAMSAHYGTAHVRRMSRIKTGHGRFTCEVCGKKFTTNGWLKQHLATLHGIGDAKRFPCSICTSIFNQKVSLQRHMRNEHSWHCRWQPCVYVRLVKTFNVVQYLCKGRNFNEHCLYIRLTMYHVCNFLRRVCMRLSLCVYTVHVHTHTHMCVFMLSRKTTLN